MKKALHLKTPIEDNIYYKNNPDYFMQLKELVENNILSFFNMLRRDGIYYTFRNGQKIKHYNPEKDRSHLLKWINDNLPLLQDPVYNLSTKCYWILNGLIDFPICPQCGKSEKYIGKNVGILVGYCNHCCKSCGAKSEEAKSKSKQTCIKLYSVDNYSKTPQYLQRVRKTKKRKYGNPKYINSEKAKQTRYAKNGGKYESDETKEIRKQKSRERHGTDFPTQDPAIGRKISATKKNKTEEEKLEIELKKQATWMKTLGVSHPSKSSIVQSKIKATTKEHFGVENYAQSEEAKLKWQDEKWVTTLVNAVIESKRAKGTLNSSKTRA